MSNENDKKSSLEKLAIIIRAIADIIKVIGSSSQSLTTIAIAISFSVTLSAVTIMYVPQVQEALIGPPGDTGPQGEIGPAGAFGAPDYDSGWVTIAEGQVLELQHNLNSRELFVYLLGREEHSMYGVYTHQWYLHGDARVTTSPPLIVESRGLCWLTTSDNVINLQRLPSDLYWQEVRVLIWQLPPPPP